MDKKIVFSKTTTIALIFLGISTLIVGIIYLLYQFYLIKTTKDHIYIYMLIISSNVLLFGYFWVIKHINTKLYDIVCKGEFINEALYQKTISFYTTRINIWFAFIFAILAFMFFAFFLGTWEVHDNLRYFLAIFQTFVGFTCGLGVIMLFQFLRSTKMIFDQLNLPFLNYNNPILRLLLEKSRDATIFASLYVGISMTSILFSKVYSYDLFWRLYLTFSIIYIICAYLIPLIPITHKMNNAKANALNSLETKMNEIFEREINNKKFSAKKLEYFTQINKVRSEILSIRSRYFNHQWLFPIVIVLIGSGLPEIVRLILKQIN